MLNVAGSDLYINNADWRFEKVSETRLNLVMDFESISLYWELSCGRKESLDIRIRLEAKKPIKLISRNIILELEGKYQNWATADERGDMSAFRYVNGIAPARLKDNMISAVMLKTGEGSTEGAVISFESFLGENTILGIYKRKEAQNEDVCLNFSPVIIGKAHEHEPGQYDYFEGRIAVGNTAGFKEHKPRNKLITLVDHGLEFVFERGKSRIIYNGRELTCGLGFFTSVRYSGIWYDSYQAIWHTEPGPAGKIVISGDWPYVPLSQIWEVELKGGDRIALKVRVKIHEKADIEMLQCNLMLGDFYKNWAVSDGKINGDFPDEYTADYDILPFRSWYGKGRWICAKAQGLSTVTFANTSLDDKFRGIVENTDYFYQGRLLQYQKTGVACLKSDENFFTGEITIDPNG
jgi:hypothetical protein